MYIRALYAFHLVYFMLYSSTTFLPKYFGDLGMTDGQIGVLMSLPAIAGVLVQPLWGMLSDRARLKKFVVIGLLGALGVVTFALSGVTGFAALFVGMTVFYVLQLPIAPIYATISLEYTHSIGVPYGPIRLLGTVGYQLGAILVGLLLAGSLSGLFPFIGCAVALSCVIAFFLPPVRGHQHGGERAGFRELLADRHLLAMLGMVLIGTITSQFYQSFFAKHLGDLGVSNTMTGVQLVLAVAAELPFLVFADRLWRRTSIWNWLLLGFLLNAVRWIGFALFTNAYAIMLFQIPGVTVMACFEYFPALFINQKVPERLKGSAQTLLTVTSFGVAKVIGSLLGGFISDRVGIPAVFGANGVLLLAACALLWRPTRRLIAAE